MVKVHDMKFALSIIELWKFSSSSGCFHSLYHGKGLNVNVVKPFSKSNLLMCTTSKLKLWSIFNNESNIKPHCSRQNLQNPRP